MGFTLLDQKYLQASVANESLKINTESGIEIDNRFYSIRLGRDGRISSWLDKRTKNAPRQICREGDTLNKLVLH